MGLFYPVILILRKGKSFKRIDMGFARNQNELLNEDYLSYAIRKEDLGILPSGIFPINIGQKEFDLVIRLLKKNEKLLQYLKISEGLRIPRTLEDSEPNDFEILKQFQFDKWSPIRRGSHISGSNLRSVISSKSGRYINILKDKIVIAEDALRITATIDNKKRVPQGGVYFGVLVKDTASLKYILGLLNSKLLSFIYSVLFGGMHMGGGYLRYRSEFLKNLPMKIVSESQQQTLIGLVDEMLFLNKRIDEIGDKKTDEKNRIEERIKQNGSQVDELVYKIFGLTEAEKEIVEKSYPSQSVDR